MFAPNLPPQQDNHDLPGSHFLGIPQPFVDLRLTATKNPRSSWCKNLPPPSHYRRITFPVAKLDSGKNTCPFLVQTFLKSTVLANRQTGALRCKRLRNWACNLEPAVSFEIPLCKKSAICQTFLRVDSSFLRSPNSSEKPLALKSGPDSAAPGPRFEGKWTRMLL